tara:strand:+ start:5710 stop:6636 length:927 start_codon:yes stop_codon:yes gene_type:complete
MMLLGGKLIHFPTRNLFIEGPDCSGKTTLIKEIHKITNYRWHIQDRSHISRLVFSNLYNRKTANIAHDCHFETANLNNRFIFLIPGFDTIKDRFLTRGDEIHHSVDSIRSVYDAFVYQYKKISELPNVILFNGEDAGEIAERVSCYLDIAERAQLREISDSVCRIVESSSSKEVFPLEFMIYDDGEFEESNEVILDHKPEKEYYLKIKTELFNKIDRELTGQNEYSRVEDIKSRRFVYTDDSCISFIQLSFRNDVMDFHSVIRSTEVKEVFPYDIKFLYYLASECWRKIDHSCTSARLRFNLNSAHIL